MAPAILTWTISKEFAVSSTTQTVPALPSLYDFFAPGGVLSRSQLPYEFRRGQLEMAQAVERALDENRHLIVEAGTGTGKTLAYLLPALRSGRRVIISTGTKNLQEQLFFKDIPFVESLLGPLRVCYMKGRANYLCRHKLYALRSQPILNGLEEISQYQQIAEWEKTAARYRSEPETREGTNELMERAKEAEHERDTALARYHNYEVASAAFQIGIVLCSAAVITGMVILAWLAGGVAVIGLAFTAIGMFAPHAVHLG